MPLESLHQESAILAAIERLTPEQGQEVISALLENTKTSLPICMAMVEVSQLIHQQIKDTGGYGKQVLTRRMPKEPPQPDGSQQTLKSLMILVGKNTVSAEVAEVMATELEKIRKATNEQLRTASEITEEVEVEVEIKAASEVTEETLLLEKNHKGLKRYRLQYEQLDSTSKARCSLEKLQNLLLDNNGYYLKLARRMNNKGVLFGVDKKGNPLFADEGDEPIMTNMTYRDTEDRVLYKRDKRDRKVKRGGKWVKTGYEMFPAGKKNEEILLYEQNTKKPIVSSSNREEERSIWLKDWYYAIFKPGYNGRPDSIHFGYYKDVPAFHWVTHGVRRLLRCKAPVSPEQVEKRLLVYKRQYEGNNFDSESRTRCSWETIRLRLLADGGRQLQRAEALRGKGVLFGVDRNGKALFADKGVEPVLTGMNYHKTRNRVLYEHNEQGKMIMQNEKPVPTGYEMFPEEEIAQYEKNTQRPIVAPYNRKGRRSIWLESGAAPSMARIANFNSYFYNLNNNWLRDRAYVDVGNPKRHDFFQGSKRLLRV